MAGETASPCETLLSDDLLESWLFMKAATPSAALSSGAAPAGETILWQGTPSRWNYLGSWFWGALLLPVGAGLLILMGAYLRRRSLRYTVTSEELVARYGLLVVSSRSLRICDVRTINIYRRGFAGLFGLGTVEFSSAAHDAASVYFHGILEAESVADTVRALQAGGTPPALPGSHETEPIAAAMLHFVGLALVPMLCVLVFGLRMRDTIQEAAPDIRTTVAAIDETPENDPGSSTTVLPTPALSEPPASRASADRNDPSDGAAVRQPPGAPRAARLRSDSPAAFARAVTASQTRAVRRYPSLGIPGSHFNTAFVARYEQLTREHSARLQDPNWPEQLAAECATKVPAAYQ